MGDGANRRECFAAEPQRVNGKKIVAVELRCGVALDAQREVAFVHAAAVVGDADQREATRRRDDLDLGRASVERILDELFHDARGAFNHLARSDAIHGFRTELANGHVVWCFRIYPGCKVPRLGSAKKAFRAALRYGCTTLPIS